MSTIFLVGNDNQLTPMARATYESEDFLQKLLADHPAVLGIAGGGDELLLVTREAGIPDEAGASDRWALDHLFLDREGVPVLVEVKRASDTRARREVVAQMLDYAAHITAHWEPGRVADEFRGSCAARDIDPDAQLAAFIGDGADADDWWRRVEANLKSGRVRLVFVADQISSELKRIVEFLNEQMRPAEVLAVEVEQFVAAGGIRTLVPRLLGDTQRAQAAKAVQESRPRLSEAEWWTMFRDRNGNVAADAAEKAIAWFKSIGWSAGLSTAQDSVVISAEAEDGKRTWPFFIRTTGRLELCLQHLRGRPIYAEDSARIELGKRFAELPGLDVTWTGKATGWPSFPVAQLSNEEHWHTFQTFAAEVLQAARRSLP